MTLTGEHPMESWARLPGLEGWFPWFMSVLSIFCFPFWLAGLPMMLGTLMNHLAGVTDGDPNYLLYTRIWGTCFVVAAVTLTILQPYSFLEKVQTGIVAILLVSILVSVIASPADWSAILEGVFVVKMPSFKEWFPANYPDDAANLTVIVVMVTFMGAIGGGTYDYIGYLGCYREKDWGALGLQQDADAKDTLDALQDSKIGALPIGESAENRKRARAWLRAPLIDVGVSFVAVLIFTYAFVILGAAILHPKQIVPSGLTLLSEQVQFLTHLSESLKYVYYAGVIMAFWGTIYGGYEIYIRTGYECLRSVSRRIRHTPIEKIKPWILLYCGTGALVLMWTLKTPTDIVKPAAILGGALLCGVWCFAMIYADRKFLPRPLQMSWLLVVLNFLCGATLTAFGVKACYDLAITWYHAIQTALAAG
jgi:Mn2+/Fe2+ NRAMP family transporter